MGKGTRAVGPACLRGISNARLNLFVGSTALTYMCVSAVTNVLLGLYFVEAGFDEAFIGGTIAARTFALAAAGLFVGSLTGLVGRRNTAVAGIVLSALGYIGQVLTGIPELVYAFSVLNGAGYAMIYINESPFVAQYANSGREVEAFSFCFAASMGATVLGSCLAGTVQSLFAADSLRKAVLLFSALSLAAALPMLRLKNVRSRSGNGWCNFVYGLGLVRDRKNALTVLFNFVLGFGAGLIVPFMNVFLRYKLGSDSQQIGNIMGFAEIATVVGVVAVSWLARRFRKEKILVVSQLASLPFILCIAFSENVALTMLATFIRNALMNMCMPVMSAVYMEGVDDDDRPALSGLINAANNAGRTLSALVAGWLIVSMGYEATYVLAAVCYLAAALLFALVGRAAAGVRCGTCK